MNLLFNRPLIFSLAGILVGAMTLSLGCGVKGDPLPPERPADLGRGRPTYKRAIEGLKIERVPVDDEESEEDED